MNEKKERNMLSRPQGYRLMKWVEANTARVMEITDDAAAAMARVALGFAVTAANIGGARKDLGLAKHAPHAPRGLGRVNEVKNLAAAVLFLYRELELPKPDWLTEMAGNPPPPKSHGPANSGDVLPLH